jgi:cytochrome c-type biogenesis protein CcmH
MGRRCSWRLVVAGLFCCTLLIPFTVSATPASFQDVEESLTCQCGCGLTVHSCNHLQCGSAIPLREEIRAQMKEGKDKEAILAYFSVKYGEKILSSPTTSGFNLVAWVTPFVLLGVGGVFVGVTVIRWTGRGRAAPVSTVPPPPPAAATPYEQILEKELKEFDS